jgi:aminomethyltransferase
VAAEELYLMVPASSFAGVLQKFTLYVIADDVTLADVGEQRALLSVQGPKAGEIAASLGIELGDAELWHRKTRLGEIDVRIVRHDRAGNGGFDLIVAKDSAADVASTLRKAVEEHGGSAMSAEAYDSLRIANAVPLFGSEIDERMLPQEAFLDKSHVSFDKGCYPGQETVAKIHYRGKVNRLLVGFDFDGADMPAKDADVESGETTAGILTSVTALGDGSVVGLGFVKREFAEADKAVKVGQVTGRVRPIG